MTRLFVEYDSGDRFVAKPGFGQTVAVKGSSPINVLFIAYDAERHLFLFAEKLDGPWHWFDGKMLNRVSEK